VNLSTRLESKGERKAGEEGHRQGSGEGKEDFLHIKIVGVNMAKFSQEEKDLIYRIHLLSGKPLSDVNDMFESFCLCAVLACLEKEPLQVPMIGEMNVIYNGEDISALGKEAKVEISVTPNKFLKKVIGQVQDGEESDIEKSFELKIKNILKSLV